MRQRTICKAGTLKGTGIHSGQTVHVQLLPAATDEGIRFVCNHSSIDAIFTNVSNTQLATTLQHQSATIRTVEHLLAAAYGLGITNLIVKTDADELPIGDGSSRMWVELLKSCGYENQEGERRLLKIVKTMEIRNDQKNTRIRIIPSDVFEIYYQFQLPGARVQSYDFKFTPENFCREIAPARTFAWLSEFEILQKNNFAKGADIRSGFILIDQTNYELPNTLHRYESEGVAVLSSEPPRFPEEAARHKILDIIGDLALTGKLISGRVEAVGTGHTENIALLKKIMQPTNDYFQTF